MALFLPAGDAKSLIVPMTYIIVLFSVLVQGLSFQRVIGFIVVPKIIESLSTPPQGGVWLRETPL